MTLPDRSELLTWLDMKFGAMNYSVLMFRPNGSCPGVRYGTHDATLKQRLLPFTALRWPA